MTVVMRDDEQADRLPSTIRLTSIGRRAAAGLMCTVLVATGCSTDSTPRSESEAFGGILREANDEPVPWTALVREEQDQICVLQFAVGSEAVVSEQKCVSTPTEPVVLLSAVLADGQRVHLADVLGRRVTGIESTGVGSSSLSHNQSGDYVAVLVEGSSRDNLTFADGEKLSIPS